MNINTLDSWNHFQKEISLHFLQQTNSPVRAKWFCQDPEFPTLCSSLQVSSESSSEVLTEASLLPPEDNAAKRGASWWVFDSQSAFSYTKMSSKLLKQQNESVSEEQFKASCWHEEGHRKHGKPRCAMVSLEAFHTVRVKQPKNISLLWPCTYSTHVRTVWGFFFNLSL